MEIESEINSQELEGKEKSGDESVSHEKETELIAEARERFLRLLLAAENNEAQFRMYESTTVTGTFQTTDASFENIAVSELKTPIAVYEATRLRVSDVLTISLDMIEAEENDKTT